MKKIILLFGIAWLLFTATASFAQNPQSSKACAICHYRWVDTFYVDGRGSDLVDYQGEKVVATEEMCFSCHDGSVKDSRQRFYGGAGHKTGQRPTSGTSIPEAFPLDDQGRVQCATCHTAHGVPGGSNKKETIFLRTSNRDSAMCRACHPAKGTGPGMVNHPEGGVKRASGAESASAGPTAEKSGKITCESCHTAHGSRHEAYLVESPANPDLCRKCHADSHRSGNDKRKAYHVFDAASEKKKIKIPEAVVAAGGKVGQDGSVGCLTCHKVHGAKGKQSLLVIKTEAGSDFCLACHADKNFLSGTAHDLNRSAPAEKNREGKTVAQAGMCSACHLPHGPARTVSEKSGDFIAGFCLGCHSRGNIAEKRIPADILHPLGVASPKNGTASILPVFDKDGFRNQKGKMTCATCHDPHGGVQGPEGDSRNSFLRLANSPRPVLCESCHPFEVTVAGTDHDLAVTAPASVNLLGQTPAQSGACGACHAVHGGRSNAFLWARNLSKDNGRSMADSLCVSCHSPEGPANRKVPKADHHPDKKLVSSDSPADGPNYLPLFDNRPPDEMTPAAVGNVSCLSCHQPHRWTSTSAAKGRGLNEEGNAATSFLRNRSEVMLCKDCHGRDALFRYKFYHDPEARNRQKPLDSK